MLQITHQNKPVVFIADLHLSEDRPDISAAFHRFIEQLSDIDALYIMGILLKFGSVMIYAMIFILKMHVY